MSVSRHFGPVKIRTSAGFLVEVDLSGTCGLNLYDGEHADPNDVLPMLILDNHELLETMEPVLQVLSGKIGCCAHSELLNSLQVGKFRTFLIEYTLAIPFHMEVIAGHQ